MPALATPKSKAAAPTTPQPAPQGPKYAPDSPEGKALVRVRSWYTIDASPGRQPSWQESIVQARARKLSGVFSAWHFAKNHGVLIGRDHVLSEEPLAAAMKVALANVIETHGMRTLAIALVEARVMANVPHSMRTDDRVVIAGNRWLGAQRTVMRFLPNVPEACGSLDVVPPGPLGKLAAQNRDKLRDEFLTAAATASYTTAEKEVMDIAAPSVAFKTGLAQVLDGWALLATAVSGVPAAFPEGFAASWAECPVTALESSGLLPELTEIILRTP